MWWIKCDLVCMYSADVIDFRLLVPKYYKQNKTATTEIN